MYLNIVSALRLPNEAISGTPHIAGPNTFQQREEVHSSNNAKYLYSLPTSICFYLTVWLRHGEWWILEGRQNHALCPHG